tara:strand:+ start:201 stop:383 length:183 start_codon:yes stop_codon:yes gene_type:complete
MVELEADDYSEIFNWFTHKFGITQNMKSIPAEAFRVFWKLTFLAEDKLKEMKVEKDEKDE